MERLAFPKICEDDSVSVPVAAACAYGAIGKPIIISILAASNKVAVAALNCLENSQFVFRL